MRLPIYSFRTPAQAPRRSLCEDPLRRSFLSAGRGGRIMSQHFFPRRGGNMRRLQLSIALLLLLTVPMAAQSVQATLTGRLFDTSGAGVPNVPVQVKNVETNQVTTTVTNSSGQYTTPYLQPGRYSVTVEAPGFKKLVRDNVEL